MSYFPKATFLVGQLLGANMNTTADQAINILVPRYRIPAGHLFLTNASISMTNAVGGIYTGAGKTGIQVIAAISVWSGLVTPSSLVAPAINNNEPRSESTLYLSLTTAQGAPATCDIYIFGMVF